MSVAYLSFIQDWNTRKLMCYWKVTPSLVNSPVILR